MTDKWTCTTFVAECKKETMRWFDRWNPWALRRAIARQSKELTDLESRFQMCVKQLNESSKSSAEQKKRIEELENELRGKQEECDMHRKLSESNFYRLVQMQTKINTFAGLLQELANDRQMASKEK